MPASPPDLYPPPLPGEPPLPDEQREDTVPPLSPLPPGPMRSPYDDPPDPAPADLPVNG